MGCLVNSAALLLLLVLLVFLPREESSSSRICVEAARVPLLFRPPLHHPDRQLQGHSSISISDSKQQLFSTLGMVCKCCDGTASTAPELGDCTTSWTTTASCSNLHCHPWKLYH